MNERGDCFDKLFRLTNRFVSNEEKAFDRLVGFAAGDSPPMDEHGNYIDDSAKLDRQREKNGQRLLLCINKCFHFEKERGYDSDELRDALIVLEKAVSSLNEWKPEVDLRGYESEEASWEGGLRGVGWDDGKAKLKASIELVMRSLDNVFRLRVLASKTLNQRETSAYGVSLIEVALVLCDGDKQAAQVTKKRWQNSRTPELPTSIGVDPRHSQTKLYSLSAILKFVKFIENRLDSDIRGIEMTLKTKKRAPRPASETV